MEHLTKNDVSPKILQALMNYDAGTAAGDALDNEMILNMGPQHPATHGVLRLLLRLDGETVINCVPELGYLHRGYEKMAENMGYLEFVPHTDRLDYLSPPANNVAYMLAVEKLAGIEAPKRAQYIRMIVCELTRIGSHLVAIGALAMDVGALTVFLWTLREREKILDIFDHVCGARFTTSFARPGGVAQDITESSITMIQDFIAQFSEKIDEVERLLNGNRIFLERLEGIGVLSAAEAIDIGLTGPSLRASGVKFDIRRAKPYLFYNEIDFEIPVYTEGDSLARYFVRADEIRESAKIVTQSLRQLPAGPTLANQPKQVMPRKVEIYTQMEELIHDFMLVNFGMNPPVGEVFHSVENSKGELGFYIVSKGEGHPWKMKIRSPSFANLQAVPALVRGHMISDVVAIVGSLDPVMGEADK